MKLNRWLILLLLLGTFAAAAARSYRPAEIPNVQRADRNRYVSNPDGILSAETVARIDSLCAALRTQGLAQVAVVAVDEIAGDRPFDFAIELFRSWGVGDSRNNNGLGILLVKRLREIRFVTGGGLEGVLPDAICKRIQTQFMLPAFRSGNYDAGMLAGVGAVAAVLREGGEALPEDAADDVPPAWLILLLFGLILGGPLVAVAVYYCAQHRCPNCKHLSLKVSGVQMLSGGVRFSTFSYSYCCKRCGYETKRIARVAHLPANGPGGPFPGGGFGSGLGGGSIGGGFGGGSFGGGGAGSRW